MNRPSARQLAEVVAYIETHAVPNSVKLLAAELLASRAEIRRALAHDDLTLREFLEEEVRRWTEE